ncbi:MAG TPA: hypothetical protein VFF66_08015 [Brevundimonas sp.]|nr:hypothetical protein [Brevundimonas sp.]
MRIPAATLAAVLIFGATGAAAQTEDWRLLAQDGPVDVAVDVASFSGPPDRRTVRSAMVSREEDDPFAYLIVDVVIDCTARTISAEAMSARDVGGAVLRQQDLPPETAPVNEADGTAATARAACEGAEISQTRFESAPAFAAWAMARRSG